MKQAKMIKRDLANYGRKIARRHLVMGAMGNISAKEKRVIWLKRGGVWLEKARPKDFLALDVKSGKAQADCAPSKEMFLHLGCYEARSDIQAVVHTHPVMATALATAGFNFMRNFKAIILPYYPPGSKKLAREVKRAVKKADIVLLADHGLVTVGKNLRQAFSRTIACEQAAKKILKDSLFL